MIKAKKFKPSSVTISVEVLQEGKEEESYSQEDQPIKRKEVFRNY